MKIKDLLDGAPIEAAELKGSENPFRNPELLLGAQLTRVMVAATPGTVGAFFELRQAPRLLGNTALLRASGATLRKWIHTGYVDEFTAWSLTAVKIDQSPDGFHLIAQFCPAGTLLLVAAKAELFLLQAAPAPLPAGGPADVRQLLRFGIADEDSDCELLAVARLRVSPEA